MSDREDGVRIAKVLASRGVASRRGAEKLIAEGEVTVNGTVVSEPGTRVDPKQDAIKVFGKPLPEEQPHVYYLLYKPKGYITGRNDPQGRKSVLELVEHLSIRMEPVGRLDYDTEGALLLTNDGDLAHRLTHPSSEVPKRYRAKVYRTPDSRDLEAIQKGKVFLEDGPALPAKVRLLEGTDANNAWVEITVTEGRNRLIRRLFAQLGHPVAKLRRESFATLTIRNMERGDLRPVTPEELRRIRDISLGIRPKRAGKIRRKEGFAKPKPKKKRHGQRKKSKPRGRR
jgi:23S rRNA pseudouridine2605 synthase